MAEEESRRMATDEAGVCWCGSGVVVRERMVKSNNAYSNTKDVTGYPFMAPWLTERPLED